MEILLLAQGINTEALNAIAEKGIATAAIIAIIVSGIGTFGVVALMYAILKRITGDSVGLQDAFKETNKLFSNTIEELKGALATNKHLTSRLDEIEASHIQMHGETQTVTQQVSVTLNGISKTMEALTQTLDRIGAAIETTEKRQTEGNATLGSHLQTLEWALTSMSNNNQTLHDRLAAIEKELINLQKSNQNISKLVTDALHRATQEVRRAVECAGKNNKSPFSEEEKDERTGQHPEQSDVSDQSESEDGRPL